MSASESKFYRQLVASLPLGMAVLRLAEPDKPDTWKLMACNAKAALAAGPRLSDYLNLPVLGKGGFTSPRDLAKAYRHVLLNRRRAV